MPEPNQPISVAPLRIGDRVRIKGHEGMLARIVEFRGPLGPRGVPIYRVRIRSKPVPSFIEVREDQLEPVRPLVPLETVRLLKGARRRPRISRLAAKRPRPR